MNVDLLWICLLIIAAVVFYTQCIMQLNLKIDASFIFCLSLFFDCFGFYFKMFIPVSPLLLLIAFSLFLVFIVVMDKLAKPLDLFNDSAIWLWFFFILYAVTSLLWSENVTGGMNKVVIMLIRGVLPALFTYIVFNQYKRFSWNIVALCGLFFAISLLMFGVYPSEYPGRLTLPGSNPIFNARLAFLTVTVCLWATNISLLLRIVTIGFTLTAGLLTQSRGPMVIFIIVNLAFGIHYLYLKAKAGARKYILRIVTAAFGAIIIIGIVFSYYAYEFQHWIKSSRFAALMNTAQLLGDNNVIGRITLQYNALMEFETSPFFGIGLGGASPPIVEDFPHNVLVEIVSELGIIGSLLWLLAILFSWIAAREHRVIRALLLLTIGYSLISGDFGYNYEYILIAITSVAFVRTKLRKEGAYEKNPLPYNST